MILPCEILQLDIPDVGRNHILYIIILVPVRKIISVQEIFSDSDTGKEKMQNILKHKNMY